MSMDNLTSMPEIFATPDDLGELRASDLHTSAWEQLDARAGEAFMGGTRTFTRMREYRQAERGEETLGSQIERIQQGGEDINDLLDRPKVAPDLPIADAKARVKREGLESHLNLPDQPWIKEPVLDLMINHAHERRRYEAVMSRAWPREPGPVGFLQGMGLDALGYITEIGLGMIDPINIAAFAMPVVGSSRLRLREGLR
jgi:hypothetical protein